MYFDSSYLMRFLTMPRVVPDQRRKFDTDEIFLNLSRPSEVRYTGLPLGTDEERRTRFKQDCRDGRIEIACIPNGFNLELFATPQRVNEPEMDQLSRDYIEIGADRIKVHICCHFIMNGVCVKWRGWIDSNTLRGQGSLEFDEDRARVEDQSLRDEMRAIEERLRHFDHNRSFLRTLSMPLVPAVPNIRTTTTTYSQMNPSQNESSTTHSSFRPFNSTSSSPTNDTQGSEN